MSAEPTFEVRLVTAARARLPMPAVATAMRIALHEGRVAALGIEGVVAAGRGVRQIHVTLMPRVRASLAERLCAGLRPWEHLIVDQMRSLEAAGDGALYVLANGTDARSAVNRLWEIGGTRAIFGEAQRRFGLDESWYAVRMDPRIVMACVAARSMTHDLLRRARTPHSPLEQLQAGAEPWRVRT
jgi:hypothetical protein